MRECVNALLHSGQGQSGHFFVGKFGTKVAERCKSATFLSLASLMKLDQAISYSLQQIRAGQHIAQYQATKPEGNTTTPSTGTPATTTPSTPVSNPNNGSNPNIGNNDSTTGKPRTHLDFTQMSRSQLNDWLSKAKTAGKLSSEQETAFKVLTYSSKTGSSANSDTQDNEQVNFTEKAKQGLESAVKRRDRSAMTFWANTLAVMKNFQGEKLATTEPTA